MTQMWSSDSRNLCLAVYFLSVFSTCSTKQCELQNVDKLTPGSATIRNIGIKLCQVRCNEKGRCLSFEYNHETLTCRQSSDEAKKIKKREGYIVQSKDHTYVKTWPCASKTCSLISRCLNTRSGKAVCVNASSDPSQHPSHSERVSLLPVTTRSSASQGSWENPADAVCRRLHYACENGYLERVRKILSKTGVNILNCRVKGMTPLMEAAEEGNRDILELLISKGADVSLVDDDCDTILHLACYGGETETVKYILSLNAVDINKSRGMKNRTPVMAAAYPGNEKVVKLLVTKGVDVSLVDDYGDTILHLACRRGYERMVRFLLSLNVVDIDARNKKGRTAADVARDKGHGRVVRLLVSRGAH